MDFEFRRMDFNDIPSIANYGQEVLEEARTQNINDKNIINVNLKDGSIKKILESIPLSIDNQIDKNISESTPASLSLMDKLLSFKIMGLIPNLFDWKGKVADKIDEVENHNEKNNSINLYQTIMQNIDEMRFKLEDEYTVLEETVKTLNLSKESLIELLNKLDYVIEVGEKDIEAYKNSDVIDDLKDKKVEMATRQILSLKKSKTTIQGFIQSKDVSTINIFMYAMNLRDWLQNNYPLLSHSVENAIETKYISNKVELMSEINETSNNIITGSAEKLKIATEKNVKMLNEGSLTVSTINKYLKTVNEALAPIKGYIDNKENITKKLMSDIDKMQNEINKNNAVLESIGENYIAPSIGEVKQLKLGARSTYHE